MPSIRLIAAAIMVTSAGAFTPSAHRTLASRPTDRSETARFGGFSEDYGNILLCTVKRVALG